MVSPQVLGTSQRGPAATAALVELPPPCFVGFGKEIKCFQILKTPCERVGHFGFCWCFWIVVQDNLFHSGCKIVINVTVVPELPRCWLGTVELHCLALVACWRLLVGKRATSSEINLNITFGDSLLC